MRRLLLASIALCLAGGFLPPAAPALAAGQPRLGIGVLLPMSGELSVHTPQVMNGIILAARLLQEPAAGPRIELLARDGPTDADAAVDAARKLAESGVGAILGPLTSEGVIRVADEVAVPGRLVLVAPSATSPDISRLRDDDLVFRTAPSDTIQGAVLARVALEHGYERVSALYASSLYGKGIFRSFRQALERSGGEVPAAVPFISAQVSYRAELAQALEPAPAALLVAAAVPEGLRIVKQAAEMVPGTRFLFPDSMNSPEIAAKLGKDVLAGCWGTSPAPPATPLAGRFRETFRRAFDETASSPYVENAFDAVMLLGLAAAARAATGQDLGASLRAVAGPPGEQVDFTTVGRALELLARGGDIDYEGVSGSLDLDANGDVTSGCYSLWTVEEGSLKDAGLETCTVPQP